LRRAQPGAKGKGTTVVAGRRIRIETVAMHRRASTTTALQLLLFLLLLFVCRRRGVSRCGQGRAAATVVDSIALPPHQPSPRARRQPRW
jgi:uncharacterized membrane protein YozB (DUF420 family)